MTSYLRELTISYAKADPPITLDSSRPQLVTPPAAAALAIQLLDREPSEVGGLLLLDTKGRLLCWHEVSRGGLTSCLIDPRSVYRAALAANAAALILCHNHPSGDPSPSADDLALTKRIQGAGLVLGLELIDHIIVGGGTGRYYSFKEGGQL